MNGYRMEQYIQYSLAKRRTAKEKNNTRTSGRGYFLSSTFVNSPSRSSVSNA